MIINKQLIINLQHDIPMYIIPYVFYNFIRFKIHSLYILYDFFYISGKIVGIVDIFIRFYNYSLGNYSVDIKYYRKYIIMTILLAK